jgi:hypothetical protein
MCVEAQARKIVLVNSDIYELLRITNLRGQKYEA